MSAKFIQIERRNKISRREFSEIFDVLTEQTWKPVYREPIPSEKLGGRVENKFLTPKHVSFPDCRTCGLCCSALYSVQLTRSDPTSEEHFWDITIEGQNDKEIVVDRVLRRNSQTGRCLSLSGEIGKDVKCEIYEQRPQACRSLEADSDACHSLRRSFGMEAPLSQMEMAEGLVKFFEYEMPAQSERIINSKISRDGEASYCEINVYFRDEQNNIIHKFDPEKEEWLEADFLGLTLQEARELILSGRSI